MSTKTYSDIKCLVKNEIDSIRRRDGELPPTAYVVIEVATRLKTVQPWAGYDAKKTLAINLRGVVEEITKGKTNTLRVRNAEDKDMDVLWINPSPYDALEDSLGDRVRVGRSVDATPISTRKEKLKKRLREAS
jgi:hypothetical protein